jgi:hypothetical protein
VQTNTATIDFEDLEEENHDFDDEEKTPLVAFETMAEVMESVRSPGIPTLTSDLPTKSHRRPSITDNTGRQ